MIKINIHGIDLFFLINKTPTPTPSFAHSIVSVSLKLVTYIQGFTCGLVGTKHIEVSWKGSRNVAAVEALIDHSAVHVLSTVTCINPM